MKNLIRRYDDLRMIHPKLREIVLQYPELMSEVTKRNPRMTVHTVKQTETRRIIYFATKDEVLYKNRFRYIYGRGKFRNANPFSKGIDFKEVEFTKVVSTNGPRKAVTKMRELMLKEHPEIALDALRR